MGAPEPESGRSRQPGADDGTPLLLDEEPLLLEEGEEEFLSPEDARADNSRCHVCHMNYVREEIAVTHARGGIGCAGCHGESDAHIADESWASGGNGTAPDIMYPRPDINPFCMKCHSRDKIDIEEHQPLLAGTGEGGYCTDCHGDHRLGRRRCKWK